MSFKPSLLELKIIAALTNRPMLTADLFHEVTELESQHQAAMCIGNLVKAGVVKKLNSDNGFTLTDLYREYSRLAFVVDLLVQSKHSNKHSLDVKTRVLQHFITTCRDDVADVLESIVEDLNVLNNLQGSSSKEAA
ncbi:hypothetical protein [Catenovulum sediminis]|uniref:hypothetical protein n=1 Tax=Catenovulum sediminis TaxID=1740262 RepID=UPI00117C3AB3|nr:hypothetical protein [Catenovulum sediminis]